MKTLGRNQDNDLYLEAGGLAILHDADAQCAIIESILQTQRGELQFDPDGGIDYFGTVLQNPNNIDFWAGEVTSKIESLAFVSSVEDFTYRFDRASSTLYWTMTVVTVDNIRLDLQNKKTVLSGSPGVDVDWKNVYDKPSGIDEAIDLVEGMRDAAQDLNELTDSSTLSAVKDTLNGVIFDSTNKKYRESRQIKFTFAGVPAGTVIDFGNLLLGLQNTGTATEPRYVPFTVEISDGTKRRILTKPDGSPLSAEGNKVWFTDENAKHTIMANGAVDVIITGNITSIKSSLTDKPIFLANDGTPFPYLDKLALGARVPLETIGEGVFRGFKNLQSIAWNGPSESVYNISVGDFAFAGCEALASLKWMQDRTMSIGKGCFKGCRSLQSLEGLTITSETEDASTLPDGAFEGCSSLQSLAHIPSTIISLGERTFAGCKSLKNLNALLDGIKEFGDYCFSGCTGLETILYLPNDLESIGNGCFSKLVIAEEGVDFPACTSLRSLFVAEGIAIGKAAFANCTALTNVMCESATPPVISEDTFDQPTLDIYVPIGSLEDYKSATGWSKYWHEDEEENSIFEYGEFRVGLSGIKAGDTLLGTTSVIESASIWQVEYSGTEKNVYRYESTGTSLPEFTYLQVPNDGEEGASKVIIKGFIKRVSARPLKDYPIITTSAGEETPQVVSLTTTLSTSLEQIGNNAFHNCVNLSEIDLGVESDVPFCLGGAAFSNCSSLESMSWLNSRPNFGRVVESITQEYVLDEYGNIQYDEAGNPIKKDVPVYLPAFGLSCFEKSGITKLDYPTEFVHELPYYCFSETKIESLDGMGSDSLTTLGANCFDGCSFLGIGDTEEEGYGIKKLKETGVTSIPESCFANCSSLRSISGIENITELGAHCFENCTSLPDIQALSEAHNVSAIPDYAFAGCTSLTSLDGIEGVLSGDVRTGIVSFGAYAFAGCENLVDISAIKEVHRTVLGSSGIIETIPAHCFDGCAIQTLVGCINISSIGNGAFANCQQLLAPSGLGASITSIGDYAFQNCSSLQYFSCLPQTPPTIGSNAFSGVDTSNMPLYVRKGSEAKYGAASVWGSVFANRVRSRSITVSFSNVNEITAETAANTVVTSLIGGGEVGDPIHGVWFVDYGDGGDFAVYHPGATQIEGHSIGDSITLFGDITEISGKLKEDDPEGEPEEKTRDPFLYGINSDVLGIDVQSPFLQKIGDCCFYDYGIEGQPLAVALNMAEGGEIGDYAFAKPSDSTRGLLGTISKCTAAIVGSHAFENSGLDASAPFVGIESAGDYAFANNPALKELNGFSLLVEVSKGMFAGCTGLTTTVGLSRVENIGEEAFDGCSSLVTVRSFGSSLHTIGENAFKDCDGITTIFMVAETPPQLASNGFSDEVFNHATVYVPAGRVDAYIEAGKPDAEKTNNWYRFGDRLKTRYIEFTLENVAKNDVIPAGIFTVEASGSWTISYEEGAPKGFASYGAGTTNLPLYRFATAGDKSIKISGPITSIRSNISGFNYVSIFGADVGNKLTSIQCTDAMEIVSIGNYAFYGCSNLSAVKGFGQVESIGNAAFYSCVKLDNVETFTGVKTIGIGAFSNCTSLKSLYGMSSVTDIGSQAFYGCNNLESIDGLGVNVASIGQQAFLLCYNIKEVQMFAETPPSLGSWAFDWSVVNSAPLYVRSKSISAYAGNEAWGVFKNIRSRYVEFSLANAPANLEILGDCGKFKSNTFWVVDWDANQSDSGDGRATETVDGLSVQPEYYLPGHIYASPGNNTFRLEGAITYITGSLSEHEPADEDPESIPPADITGTRFLMFKDGADEDEYLVGVSRSEHSVLSGIGEASFLKNKGLTKTSLKGVTSIGDAAFAYTRVESCEMLYDVSKIGKCAFYECKGLDVVQDLEAESITIGDYAFAGLNTTDGHPEYIQISVPDASYAKITDYSFGKFESPAAQKNVSVYVPLNAVASYQNESEDNPWRKFTIASRIIEFTLENVPSGTRFRGLSPDNSLGQAEIHSETHWTIDWGDGTRDTMSPSDTTFPEHVYIYSDATSSQWVEQVINGTSTWIREKTVISITGDIRYIGCADGYPLLSTTRYDGNPYLTQVVASKSMSGLTTIGSNSFRDCINLKSVRGFVNVTTIGELAFKGCSSLVDLGTATIEDITTTTETITIDDTEETIEVKEAILGGDGFLSATFIGSQAFADCAQLQSLVAFPSVLDIGYQAFLNCYSLQGITGLGLRYRDVSAKQFEFYDKLTASFGYGAFAGCGFGAIDIENYQVPPKILDNTFPGEPQYVLVYVSSAEGVADRYRNAPVWLKYFKNIIESSTISIEIGPGEIGNPEYDEDGNVVSGTAVYGGNGRLAFEGNYISIDWGDGTSTQTTEKNSTGWTFPSHLYTKPMNGAPVSIRIRGPITKIYTGDAHDTNAINPSSTYRQFLAIATFSTTKHADGTIVTAIDTEHLKYDFKIRKLAFGSGSKLSRIGTYCFQRANIGDIEIGKPESGGIEIGNFAFRGCGYVQSVTSSSSGNVSSVGDYAFYQCSQLTDIDFLDGCISIGDKAFEGCYTLKNTNGLKETVNIGESAFEGCTGLQSISLPVTLTSVADYAFKGCTGIQDAGIAWQEATDSDTYMDKATGTKKKVLDNDSISIGDEAFAECAGAKNKAWSITIPRQVTFIGMRAFYGCGEKVINLSAALSEIGVYAFADNKALSTVNWPHSSEYGKETTIGQGCFEGCNNLVSVTSFGNATRLPAYCFFRCNSLTDLSAILPNIVGAVGQYCFAGCSSISGNVVIPDEVTSLGEGCFNNSSENFLRGRYDGSSGSDNAGSSYANMTQFEEWLNAQYGLEKRDVYPDIDGIIYNPGDADTAFTLVWPAASDSNLKSIGAGCFMNCSRLATSNMPPLNEIPKYCFYNCNRLTGGKGLGFLPEGLAVVGKFALARTDVANLNREEGTPLPAELATAQFFRCTNLTTLDGLATKIAPTSTSIPDACFYGCTSLSNITALSGFTVIGNYSFKGCTSLVNAGKMELNEDFLSIGDECFANCINLRFIPQFPAKNVSMGEAVFHGCKGLLSCEGLPSVAELPKATFKNCSSLTTLQSTERQFPSTINKLGEECFMGCSSLSDLDPLGVNLYSIGVSCFEGCESSDFTKFYGLPYVYTYPNRCFYGCKKLVSVERLSSPSKTGEFDPGLSPNNNSYNFLRIVFNPRALGIRYGWFIDSISVKTRTTSSPYWQTGWYQLAIYEGETELARSVAINISALDTMYTFEFPDTEKYDKFDNSDYSIRFLENDSTAQKQIGLAVDTTATVQPAYYLEGTTWHRPIIKMTYRTDNAPEIYPLAFGGCPNIKKVNLSSYSAVVSLLSTDEEDDPFNAIPTVEVEGVEKKNATLVVPEDLEEQYRLNAYWGKFLTIEGSDSAS